MGNRPQVFNLILLLMAGMVGALPAAESSNDTLPVSTGITDDELVIEQENAPEILPGKTVNTVTTKAKRHSIRMIIGGQSTGGLAKQVTLPVDG